MKTPSPNTPTKTEDQVRIKQESNSTTPIEISEKENMAIDDKEDTPVQDQKPKLVYAEDEKPKPNGEQAGGQIGVDLSALFRYTSPERLR